MSINKRVFGSDIPIKVKKTLQARQDLAEMDRNPGDEITGEIKDTDKNSFDGLLDDNKLSYQDLIGLNFNGIADLSSRTPFVRMWVGFDLFLRTPKEDAEEEPFDSPHQDFYVFGNSSDNFKNGKWYSNDNIENVSVTDGVPSIYVIGNNIDNQEALGIYDQRQQQGSQIADLALPLEYQINKNEFLRPPAGIISVQSETQGTLGTIKKTTVTFQVGNFIDYDKIYSKYFLKPGAQIFLDFGWDTADLYEPANLLQGICPDYDEKEKSPTYKNELEKCLYSEKTFEPNPDNPSEVINKGFDGYVTKTNGQMETFIGIVTDYNSRINTDGTITCEVTLTSKNSALVNHQSSEQKKRDSRLKHLFQQTVLFNGLFLRLGGLQQVLRPDITPKITEQQKNNKKQLEYLKRIAYAANTSKVDMEEFGISLQHKMGIINNRPGEENKKISGNLDFKLSTDYGITDDSIQTGVMGGSLGHENEIYISLGHLEDFILNPEYGFTNVDNRSSVEKNNNKIDENDISNQKSFEVKFDSSLSWTTWSKQLINHQKALLSNAQKEGLPSIIFPKWWGSKKGTVESQFVEDFELQFKPLESKDHNHINFEHGHAWNEDPNLLEQTIIDGGYTTDGFTPPPGDNNTHTIFEPTQQYEGNQNLYRGNSLRPHEMPHTKDLPENERAPWFYTGTPPGDANSNPIHTHEQLTDFETGASGGGIVPQYWWNNVSATQGFQPDTCVQTCNMFGYTCAENGCPTINYDLYGTEAEYNGGGLFYEGTPYHENWSGEPPTQYSCEDTLPVRNTIPALNPASDDPFGQNVDCCCVRPGGGTKIGGIYFTKTILNWPEGQTADDRLIRYWKCFREGMDTPGQFIDDSMYIEEGSDFGPQDCCEIMMEEVDGYVEGEQTLNTFNGNNYVEHRTDVFSQNNISNLQLWAEDDKAANGVVFRGYDCLVDRPQTSYVQIHRDNVSHEHPMQELHQPASKVHSQYEIISSYNSKYQTNFNDTWKHEFFKFYTEKEIEEMSYNQNSTYVYHDLNQSDRDKEYGRIPLREVFFDAKKLKNALTGITKNGKSEMIGVTQALQSFFDGINSDYDNIFNFKVTSGGGEDNTIAITDLNVPSIKFTQQLFTEENVFDNLFEFKVRQKNSIVKNYDINFNLGSGAIGNMMAIRGMSNQSQIIPLTEVLDTVASLEAIDALNEESGVGLTPSLKNFFVKYLPDMGNSQYITSQNKNADDTYINRGFTYVGDVLGTSFGALTGTDTDVKWTNTNPADLSSYAKINELVNEGSDNFKNLSKEFFNHNIIEWENSTNDEPLTNEDGDGPPPAPPFRQFTSLYQNYSDESLGGPSSVPSDIEYNSKGGTYKYGQVETGMKNQTQLNRELELNKGITTMANMTDYYLKEAVIESAFGRDSLLPITLTLTTYGISSLLPGDIFKVDYLPERYRQNVYFQVIQVSHQVGTDGWYTTLTTQWRIRADKKRNSNVTKVSKYALDPSEFSLIPSRLVPGIHNLQRISGENVLKADQGGIQFMSAKIFKLATAQGETDFGNNIVNDKVKIDNIFKFKWIPEGNVNAKNNPIKFHGGIIPYFAPSVFVGAFTKEIIEGLALVTNAVAPDPSSIIGRIGGMAGLGLPYYDLDNPVDNAGDARFDFSKYASESKDAVIPGIDLIYEYLGRRAADYRGNTTGYQINAGDELLGSDNQIWRDVVPGPKSWTLKYDLFDNMILEDVYDEGNGSSRFSMGSTDNYYNPGDKTKDGVNILAPNLDDSFANKEYTVNENGSVVFGDKTKEFLEEKLGKDFNKIENQQSGDLDYAKALLHLVFSKELFSYKNTAKDDEGRAHMLRIGHYLNLNYGENYYILTDNETPNAKPKQQNWLIIPEIVYSNPQAKRFCFYFLNGWMNQGSSSPFWWNSTQNSWFYQQAEIKRKREKYTNEHLNDNLSEFNAGEIDVRTEYLQGVRN